MTFTNKDECLKEEKNKKQTNTKYESFTQQFFTVGDKKQANEFLLSKTFASQKYKAKKTSIKSKFDKKPITDEIKKLMKLKFYKKFNEKSVFNTFKYMFENFGAGIYIQIKNNKLEMFVPFYNIKFKNYYQDKLKIHPRYNDNVLEILRDRIFKNEKYCSPKIHNYTNNKEKWYAINCMIFLQKSKSKEISSLYETTINHMFQELCKKNKIPDCEFFINKFDFPLINKNLTEPFYHIFGNRNTPLRKNKYDTYAPILSFSINKYNADIPIPTPDDWQIVTKMIFPYECRDMYLNNFEDIKWKDKIPTAFFRGSSTGCGFDIFNNNRLKAAYISKIWKNDDKYNQNNKIDGIPFLDAKIFTFKLIFRKNMNNKYINFIKTKKIKLEKADYFPLKEQNKYKYIIDIDGYVSSWRLPFILGSGSLILKVDSEYKLWFSDLLKPWIHYVPIKSNLSDLAQQITWCKQNDKECKKIVKNAQNFVKKYINKKNILDYLQFILTDINEIQS